jgi:hypothetical protein
MRRAITILAAAGVLLLLVAAPAVAAEYRVTKASGALAGRVLPGPDPGQGDRIGVVRDLSGFRGAVYPRQASSGYVGWPVSNGTSYIAWVRKSSTTRFLVKKVPWGATAGRVTRLSSGRWLAQKRVDGRWRTVGRIQEGCRGQWAAGAARLLLWQR